MTHDQVIQHFGTGSEAARQLNLSRQAVSRWKKAGIPFEQQFKIEMKTRGKLRAKLPL